jgi:DNA helicase-2/ATP-dependent DNA helicase PcrA
VKDLLAYLRLLVNPNDEVSFRRASQAPRRGAGQKTLDSLVIEARKRSADLLTTCLQAAAWGVRGRGLPALAAMADLLASLGGRLDDPPHVLIEAIARAIDYRGWLKEQDGTDWEQRWAHVIELIEGAKSYEGSEEGSTLAGYLEQVALYAQTDAFSACEDRVTLMTVHNAKGLEFESVFVTGLEDGLFPHISAMDDTLELEEERRLFYVATTRACRRLTLTASRQRRRINYGGSSELSRFLFEIPRELLHNESIGLGVSMPSPQRVFEEPTITREPARLQIAGLQAKHVRYGIGEVLSVDGEGDDARLEIRFPGWGRKRILRSYLTLLEDE